METLRLAVMSVVRSMGKRLNEDSFVRYFSYTKNWISPAYSRKLFKICVDSGLLKKDGDSYVPTFEFSGTIPLDFRIDEKTVDKYTVQGEIFTLMLDKLCRVRRMGRREALMNINKIKKDARYINIEVATLIFCKVNNVDCSEYYDMVERRLVV